MNLLKKILWALFGILVIIALAIWMLTKSIAPIALKDAINKQLSSITAQKSHIDGEITWHLFPRLGIKIRQIYITDDLNKVKPSLIIENLLLNLKINPLLRGQLVFKEVKIDGMTLNLNDSDAQSMTMLSGLSSTSSDGNKIPVQFAIDRFSITRGQLSITQPQQKITFSDLTINVKQFNVKNNYFPVQFNSKLALVSSENKIQGIFNYDGKIRLPSLVVTNPYAALQKSGLNGQLLINNLHVNQIKISKLSATVMTKKGAFIFDPLKMSLYSGKSTGNLSYQLSTKKLSMDQKAIKLNANPLFKQLFGKNLIKGSLDFSVHGSANLENSNWKNTINGNGSLTIKDGVLYFVDLQTLADEASNKLHSLSSQDQTAPVQPIKTTVKPAGSTPFQYINLQYRLQNRQITNDVFLLQTNTMELKGKTQLDLNSDALEGNLSAKLLTADDIVGNIQQLLGGSFPLKLQGNISQPEIVPNDREINPIMTKYMLKNVLGQPVKQIKSQITNLLNTPKALLSR